MILLNLNFFQILNYFLKLSNFFKKFNFLKKSYCCHLVLIFDIQSLLATWCYHLKPSMPPGVNNRYNCLQLIKQATKQTLQWEDKSLCFKQEWLKFMQSSRLCWRSLTNPGSDTESGLFLGFFIITCQLHFSANLNEISPPKCSCNLVKSFSLVYISIYS